MGYFAEKVWSICNDKKTQVVLFSSTAISLYGFDQSVGMMSLINTNKDYLSRMQISAESPLVGVIVAIYYLGCTVGAVFFSWLSDLLGRKRGIFFCLATASLGNLIMFVSGMGYMRGALAVMMLGRIIMGLGVGGIDAVIPVYSSELSQSEARGKALAQEFQMNIFGLNMAFAINLGVTIALGKSSQWAWRIPIIVMQAYPILLFAFIERLPESPRWCIFNGLDDAAREACEDISPGEGEKHLKELKKIHEQESDEAVSYVNMITPSHPQFHPTIITIMVQICQALTGYGAVSVYGPQIFELLGFATRPAEYLTMSNYISYLVLMTGAWLLIDAVGRRSLMLWGSSVLTSCFLLLALFGGLAMHAEDLDIPNLAVAVPGIVALFTATGAFGIGWLATVWLAPTEIVPTTARAQMAAISVIVWGVANFAITLLTPLMFNNLKYWLFLVFAASNAVAGLWTWAYLPETGGRSFEENQRFFEDAAKERTWRVGKVEGGEYLRMPYPNSEEDVGERAPLLSRVRDQL